MPAFFAFPGAPASRHTAPTVSVHFFCLSHMYHRLPWEAPYRYTELHTSEAPHTLLSLLLTGAAPISVAWGLRHVSTFSSFRARLTGGLSPRLGRVSRSYGFCPAHIWTAIVVCHTQHRHGCIFISSLLSVALHLDVIGATRYRSMSCLRHRCLLYVFCATLGGRHVPFSCGSSPLYRPLTAVSRRSMAELCQHLQGATCSMPSHQAFADWTEVEPRCIYAVPSLSSL